MIRCHGKIRRGLKTPAGSSILYLFKVFLVLPPGPDGHQDEQDKRDDHGQVNRQVVVEISMRKHVFKVHCIGHHEKPASKRRQVGALATRHQIVRIFDL